jgi:hypothetical protein
MPPSAALSVSTCDVPINPPSHFAARSAASYVLHPISYIAARSAAAARWQYFRRKSDAEMNGDLKTRGQYHKLVPTVIVIVRKGREQKAKAHARKCFRETGQIGHQLGGYRKPAGRARCHDHRGTRFESACRIEWSQGGVSSAAPGENHGPGAGRIIAAVSGGSRSAPLNENVRRPFPQGTAVR